MSRPAGIGGSVHSACTQIHSNVFCSGGWRIGTLCLYLSVHFNVTSCCVWRSGTFCLYPAPLQCLMQRGLEGRYSLSVPTNSLFTVTCRCGWRIGTLCLYPDPLQCLMQRGLEARYFLSVPTSSLFTATCCCGWRIGTFYLYPDLLHGLTPTWFHSLGLGPLLGYVTSLTLLKWGEI
jgi:hypothetical protein